MKYNKEKREILFKGKVLNNLDRFVLDFISILEKYVGYVVVSGYVSILLGRSRSSEDVDFLRKLNSEGNFYKICLTSIVN